MLTKKINKKGFIDTYVDIGIGAIIIIVTIIAVIIINIKGSDVSQQKFDEHLREHTTLQKIIPLIKEEIKPEKLSQIEYKGQHVSYLEIENLISTKKEEYYLPKYYLSDLKLSIRVYSIKGEEQVVGLTRTYLPLIDEGLLVISPHYGVEEKYLSVIKE